MAEFHEDLMDRTLRWIGDNLQGAYNAKYPPGHPKKGRHCVNLGICILVGCYINVLGKVLLKGGPASKHASKNFQRFHAFLDRCMPDFLDETSRKMSLLAPKLKNSRAADWTYKEYRCGFVHNYYPGPDGAWSRRPNLTEYWFREDSREALNVDELVRGFDRGVQKFRRLVKADPDLRTNFPKYLLA